MPSFMVKTLVFLVQKQMIYKMRGGNVNIYGGVHFFWLDVTIVKASHYVCCYVYKPISARLHTQHDFVPSS